MEKGNVDVAGQLKYDEFSIQFNAGKSQLMKKSFRPKINQS